MEKMTPESLGTDTSTALMNKKILKTCHFKLTITSFNTCNALVFKIINEFVGSFE